MKDFWAVMVLYRFYPYSLREENFFKAREVLQKQGVQVLVLEAAGEGVDFLLKEGDADKLIQIKTKSILWHKERGINLAAKATPKTAKYIAWIDADSIVNIPDWPQKTAELLEAGHPMVQLASHIQFLRENGEWERQVPLYVYAKEINSMQFTGWGAPGFAWAAKREFFEKIGLYDCFILGGGDHLFAESVMYPDIILPKGRFVATPNDSPMKKHIILWRKKLAEYIKKNGSKIPTCIRGTGLHLWHDDRKYRLYGQRHALLRDFDPTQHLKLENGTRLYAIKDEELKVAVETYFWMREQDKTPMLDYLFSIYETYVKALHGRKDFERMVIAGDVGKRRKSGKIPRGIIRGGGRREELYGAQLDKIQEQINTKTK